MPQQFGTPGDDVLTGGKARTACTASAARTRSTEGTATIGFRAATVPMR